MSNKAQIENIRKKLNVYKYELKEKYKTKFSALGYKIKDGKITNMASIMIFVPKKLSEKELTEKSIKQIPSQINNIPTDVIEFKAVPYTKDLKKYRPICGGICISHESQNKMGTLGIILKKSNLNKFFAITSNHIGANENIMNIDTFVSQKGDIWYQPSDSGHDFSQNRICKLYDWNYLNPSNSNLNPNLYDCAIGEVDTSSLDSIEPYTIFDIGKVKGWEENNQDDLVIKRGISTLKTTGKVLAVNADIQIIYKNNTVVCDFLDQVLIVSEDDPYTPFALPGDSGSIVLSKHTNGLTNTYKAKALLIGGTQISDGLHIAIASPINKIIQDFNLII